MVAGGTICTRNNEVESIILAGVRAGTSCQTGLNWKANARHSYTIRDGGDVKFGGQQAALGGYRRPRGDSPLEFLEYRASWLPQRWRLLSRDGLHLIPLSLSIVGFITYTKSAQVDSIKKLEASYGGWLSLACRN